MTQVLGRRGEALIKSFESLQLEAYRPTKDDVFTLGWGHTKGVKLGDTCTEEQAEAWFLEDVADAVEAVNRATRKTSPVWAPLSQSMFDALVSLVYNVGPAAVAPASTISDCMMDRNYYGAWRGFSLWIKQAHSPLRGLARRRAQEMALFCEDPFV